ncbi:hypothetical protein KRP22_002417 [Phytophthora ramorum]|nr:ATP-dependent protease subunit HslV [Phytophthora ramorum]
MLARSLFRAASSVRASPSLVASFANVGAMQVARFSDAPTMHGTTILCVRKGGKVCLIGDGQVSLGSTVVKPNAKKVRRIGEHIVAGFAGSTADAFTLMERLEAKLDEYPGQLSGRIGSGGTYALAAARALIDQDLDAETIARKSMKIAADICVYTNENVTVEMLGEGSLRPRLTTKSKMR